MLPPDIRQASDLVTTTEARIQGFIRQAQAKIELARPHIRDAYRLEDILAKSSSPRTLVARSENLKLLVSAVGISEKAMGHLPAPALKRIVQETISSIHVRAKDDWKKELVLRFVLTRGDSLGGTSRNLTGAIAKDLFGNAVLAALESQGHDAQAEKSEKGARQLRAVLWADRAMVFDRKPRVAGKNIDVILLDTSSGRPVGELLERKNAYVACGEVKGGIDPAGADEHWKTAHSALERIRFTFGLQTPALFFAGAAIEGSMAEEIFAQLRTNILSYAANLTKPDQLHRLADWITKL